MPTLIFDNKIFNKLRLFEELLMIFYQNHGVDQDRLIPDANPDPAK
jgi:hypothetical protein